MADPTRLFKYLNDAWDKRQVLSNPNYVVAKAIAEGTEAAREAILDFIEDQTIATADGEGLTRLGILYDLQRPSWMGDAQFQTLLGIWVSMPMCTLQKIKALFDTYTGVSCTIKDIVTDPGTVPAGQIWIVFPAGYPSLKGRWFAPGLGTTVRSRRPVSSGVYDRRYSGGGRYTKFNDYYTGIDSYLDKLLNRAKAAGTTIVYI